MTIANVQLFSVGLCIVHYCLKNHTDPALTALLHFSDVTHVICSTADPGTSPSPQIACLQLNSSCLSQTNWPLTSSASVSNIGFYYLPTSKVWSLSWLLCLLPSRIASTKIVPDDLAGGGGRESCSPGGSCPPGGMQMPACHLFLPFIPLYHPHPTHPEVGCFHHITTPSPQSRSLSSTSLASLWLLLRVVLHQAYLI